MTEADPIAKAPAITRDELRTLIERSSETPWQRIQAGDVTGRCTAWTDSYIRFFKNHGIEPVRLSSGRHAYMAVQTSDAGILIFDPTFRQIYPDYEKPYFLDTASRLVAEVEARGGWQTPLEDDVRGPINARGCFSHRGFDLPSGTGSADKKSWREALEQLPPQRQFDAWQAQKASSGRWAARLQLARSSNEVSP